VFCAIALGVTRIIRRGAWCLPEQPLVPAGNCAFKSKANREGLPFATASLASKELAVSSQHWPASLLRSKSPVLLRNTCGWEIREPSSYSGSARFVGLQSSTPKTATMSQWLSPWVRLLILSFQRLAFPFTTAVGTAGFSAAKHDGVRQRSDLVTSSAHSA
jgi:hypothetical protein